MSNRNFDNRVIIQRLQNQVYSRNLYVNNTTGKQIISNPQNTNGNASVFNTYKPGVQTQYFRGLTGSGETVSLGSIADIQETPINISSSNSIPSVSISPASIPSAPIITSITPGNQQLIVNFTAGATGGSPITNYEYSTNNGSSFTSAGTTSSPITILGLTNGTIYRVILRAVNIVGSSTNSNMISVSPAGAPEPPTALSAVGGDQAIYVLFTAGANNGNVITNYEYSVDGGITFVEFSPAQTFSPVEISNIDLINGTNYTVQLKAVNAVGSSIPSASVSVTPTTNTLNTSSLLVELDANNSSSYSGSGITWTNLRSDGSYSATLQNSPIFDATNKWFTFDGINQIAQIPAATAINPTVGSSFTLQIWARVNTTSPNFNGGDGLISKQFGFSSYDGYSLSLSTLGAVILNMNGSTVNGNYPSPANVRVYNNNWALYTIVVRFRGGTSNPSYAYVSTRRVVTANNNESNVPPTAPLQFPRGIQEANTNFCPADVGAFYLYNTAVSQEDIIRNYDATKSRYGL